MATTTEQVTTIPVEASVEERFRRLEAQWKYETGHLSSPQAICANQAYREIIGMGRAAIPFMLGDLAKEPRLWVWALREITGDNPVPERD